MITADPFVAPLQVAGVGVLEAVTPKGAVIVTVVVAVQLLASVTVIL